MMVNSEMGQNDLPFGRNADVLFQIATNGDLSMISNLCLLNKATYKTIKMLEPQICGWFKRLHGIKTFDPILTLDLWTGIQIPVTVHTLPKFLERQDIANRLARSIITSVWGPFSDDEHLEMDLDAELRLAQRLERGLYVLFHFADIYRGTERLMQWKRNPLTPAVTGQLLPLTKMLDEHDNLPEDKHSLSFEEHSNHVYTVLKLGYMEAEIGRRRLEFRSHLEEQAEIDFHAALRMLRELLERMLLRHGPKDWYQDAKNEYSVISWFLLKQSPQTLGKLFLNPQNECCDLEVKTTPIDVRECYFSDTLDNYWKEWKDDADLRCCNCDCKRRGRSWSVKPALIDARGREFNRAAERYLREMWSQRHLGLHRAFSMRYFNIF